MATGWIERRQRKLIADFQLPIFDLTRAAAPLKRWAPLLNHKSTLCRSIEVRSTSPVPPTWIL